MTFDNIVIALSLLSLVASIAVLLIPVLIAISTRFKPPSQWQQPD